MNLFVKLIAKFILNLCVSGKIIPFVPGIPGPNSLSSNAPMSPIISSIASDKSSDRIFSPNQNASGLFAGNISLGGTPTFRSINLSISSAIVSPSSMHVAKLSKSPEPPASSKILSTIKSQLSSESNDSSSNSANHPHNLSSAMQQQQQQHHAWTSTTQSRDGNQMINEKPFNFMRIADNLSPPKIRIESSSSKSRDGMLEMSATNLDKLKSRPKILAQVPDAMPLHINIESISNDASSPNIRNAHEITTPEKIKMPSMIDLDKGNAILTKNSTKFLRPSSLPLKPGTFTPKKHHGITPTANTLPLISPETPRPSKHCVQLYLNGHAYTYLGLKCSTKPFYCTVNRPQPVYAVFAGRPELSMYSNWQTCAENNPNPLGFSPKEMMSLYDSRQRSHTNYQGSKFTMSGKVTTTCAPSDKTQDPLKVFDSKDSNTRQCIDDSQNSSGELSDKVKTLNETEAKSSGVNLSTVPGGYKSNEDYTYVRGRGRGRYVCIECGMRCIKPCTLKKHIRTVHSDVRPYTCRHCMFR